MTQFRLPVLFLNRQLAKRFSMTLVMCATDREREEKYARLRSAENARREAIRDGRRMYDHAR